MIKKGKYYTLTTKLKIIFSVDRLIPSSSNNKNKDFFCYLKGLESNFKSRIKQRCPASMSHKPKRLFYGCSNSYVYLLIKSKFDSILTPCQNFPSSLSIYTRSTKLNAFQVLIPIFQSLNGLILTRTGMRSGLSPQDFF